MNIYIDIETLRAPEEVRQQIIEDVKANFKAPYNLSKGQAEKDLLANGYKFDGSAKYISKDDMIALWEKELAEVKSADVAQEKWEKTSFNPDVAAIACICIGWFDGDKYHTDEFAINQFTGGERAMLEHFHLAVSDICSANGFEIKKPNFIGHNIAKFDLPFIWKRSVINNVTTVKGVKWVDGRHGLHCFDTMVAWAGHGNTISADNLAKLLSIKGKSDIDGSMVYDTWQVEPQKVIEYCHDDVRIVKEIHERLIK